MTTAAERPHLENTEESHRNTPGSVPEPGRRAAPGGFPVVGIIGGGQLARMCAPPSVGLAVSLRVLAEGPDAAAAYVIPDAPLGAADDLEAIRTFARGCDVVTFDHEHVPPPVLAALEADGVNLQPRPAALLYAQDKLAMRTKVAELGIPSPAWRAVHTPDELVAFGAETGWPIVLKTPRGGYDGKGVLVLDSPDDLASSQDARHWFEAAADPTGRFPDGLLAEEKVDFDRELAVLVARSPSGQAVAWPVVETVQTDGICTEVLAPAPRLDPDTAARLTDAALRIAGGLGVTGVMAVEVFELGDGEASFVVNELAMRPHNSGHWTIDGAVTSQFEQHLRAVLDLPLGDPSPRAAWTVMGNVLGGDYPELYPTYRHLFARDPGLKMHLYGKEVRPGRKIGHVNVSGDDLDDLRARARHAVDYLAGVVTE